MSQNTAAQILTELRKLGNANTAKIYTRHGVTDETVGLPYGELNKLCKRLGTDPALAKALWDTGVHDARILATRLADPATMSSKQLESWLRLADNYVITGALSSLAAAMPQAAELARRWIDAKGEWRASAGWNVTASLAVDGRLDAKTASARLDRIAGEIHGAANRVSHSMNNALIAIGGSMPGLRKRALEVARAIGRVQVDHGETGCKTPEAAGYIARMVAHQDRKTRSAAKQARPGGSAAQKKRSAGRRKPARHRSC